MNKEERRKYWLRIGAGFSILALAIAFYFCIFRFNYLVSALHTVKGIMMPFIYGGVMAYALRMPCNFFEKHLTKLFPKKIKKWAPAAAIVLSFLSAVLVIYLLLSMVIPQMVVSISGIIADLPKAVEDASVWLEKTLEDNEVLKTYADTAIASITQKLQAWARGDLLPTLQSVMSGFTSTVSQVVGTLVNLGIGIVVCVYLLQSRKLFARQSKLVLYGFVRPVWADRIMEEINYADRMFVGFFSGKILDSAIIGLLCYIFSLIFGFPNAMLVSVIVGVTNIIPYFGPYIGAVPSALLILMSDPVKCVWFVVFIIILQQFDGNILGPHLLANSTGLSGFWVLFSITVFGGLFGFVGILIGVPVFAVIYDIVKKLVLYGLKKHGKMDMLKNT
ncbi:AI-2E family transporter [Marvinbryantia sp.]|uniref:AI-2E family transporter n=1 Tax=Marvinbryantia sp. TaxID=2496532 RepID=UPI0025FD03F6|nr:AI-2E family transporter [uncultured Marvinbryantia sp.]